MKRTSAAVVSSQVGPHELLLDCVKKHRDSEYKAPIAPHTEAVFLRLKITEETRPIIIDTGCGTGKSTEYLARQHPDKRVIGIDKSVERIEKYAGEKYDNMEIVRADLFVFLHLCVVHNVRLYMVGVLYPNPWPKPGYLKRRMHGHPIFPLIFPIVERWWVRTNWPVYAQEFAASVAFLSGEKCEATRIIFEKEKEYITLFEEKYDMSGHPIFEVVV